MADDVDLEAIGKNEKCSYFTGADLAALVREAGILCLQEYINSKEINKQLAIQSKHFDEAMMKIRPSVSVEVLHFIKLLYLLNVLNEFLKIMFSVIWSALFMKKKKNVISKSYN